MPGRRNYQRERAAHAAELPARMRALHAMLVDKLPAHDHLLVGHDAILAYLHFHLRLRRPGGRPLSWRMVLRWRRDAYCPILRGGWNSHSAHKHPPIATTHSLTAWMLTAFDNAARRSLFRVASSAPADADGEGARAIGYSIAHARQRAPAA
jgi:hypothetical protein